MFVLICLKGKFSRQSLAKVRFDRQLRSFVVQYFECSLFWYLCDLLGNGDLASFPAELQTTFKENFNLREVLRNHNKHNPSKIKEAGIKQTKYVNWTVENEGLQKETTPKQFSAQGSWVDLKKFHNSYSSGKYFKAIRNKPDACPQL